MATNLEQFGKTPKKGQPASSDVAKGTATIFDKPAAHPVQGRPSIGKLTGPDHCCYGLPGKVTR